MRVLPLALVLGLLTGCEMYGLPGMSASSPTVAPDLSDGTLVVGTLSDDDAQRDGGQRRDNIATVTVPVGGTLEIDMESQDFDTYLLVEMIGSDRTATNDDFNGSRQRSVIVQPNPAPEPVQALIVATAFNASGRGDYTVRYAVREPAAPPAPTATLRPGTVRGALSAATPVVPLTTGDLPRPADAYAVTLAAGERATVRMESSAFDTYLKILPPPGGSVLRNDDFQGSRSVSQITITPSISGVYTVLAGAFAANAVGDYTLSYTEGSAAPAVTPSTSASPPAAAALAGRGRTLDGVLSDDDRRVPLVASGEARLADLYTVRLEAGQTLAVVMESSAFDTYLKLTRGETFLVRNDDDGSTSRSAFRHTATVAGDYVIAAGTFHDRGRGAYTLTYTVE